MTHKDKPARKAWFIVNMTNRWDKDIIVRHQKPTRVHPTLESAYAEAARLASLHTRGDFAVFECIGRCVSLPDKKPVSEPALSSGT